jgi:hypothetical protein
MAVEETEYAGFIPTQPINWASLAEDLAGKVYNIGEERQKKREELDKIAADNQSMLNSWQPGKNQTFNQAVLRGADQGRVLIKQWNDDLKAGLISATDYKNKMNNMKEYWGILAQTAKTYDDRYLEILKRQTPDENGKIQASSFEIDMFDELAQMSNLSQSATQWDYDGRLYMANTDPNNGKIKGNIYDVRTVNLPDNIIANRVNVDDQVNAVVKNWNTKTLFEKVAKGGELTIESAKNQDSYKIMVERLANTIAPDNNPRAQISVLADNGVLTPYYYKTDQEYKAIKEQQINDLRQLKIDAGATDISLTEKELYDIEISLVRKVQDGNGLFMPVLTDEQKKLARERVKESIDIQLAEQIQKDMPNIGRGGGTTTKNKVTDASLYTTLASAWNSGDISVLNDQLRNEKYKIKTITDKSGKSLGRAVVEVKGDTEIQLTKPTDNLFDLRTYFFGTGPNAEEEAIKQRKAWLAGGKATTSTKGNQSAGAGDSIFKS